MWPWGACWLQDEACQGIVEAAQKKPLMCGLGVAVSCRMKHAKSAFEGFEGFGAFGGF